MKSKSIKAGSTGEFKVALQKAMSDGFAPTLAIVFVSVKQDRKALCEIFKKEGIDLIGATSSGEFIDGHQSSGGIVGMLLDLDKANYRILIREIGGNSLEESAKNMLEEAYASFSDPAFIL
ncbi:MAG: hypothetical protein HKP60_06050, partial [Eudoraea sp.]|nr:hypothetical protein [Eudoraea sp.]NNJ40414.1 hypothetical protein [Eudoraea sp.]